MRMAGSYRGCCLVLDHHHDSGHICGRLVGTLLATNISLVQCMVWALHACMQYPRDLCSDLLGSELLVKYYS
jgi:hypothetical protein